MFYDIFYALFSELVGETAMQTAQGQLFAQYGSYIFIVLTIVIVFSLVVKLANWFSSLWK